ncbi:unnamed protein product [Brachionus calyciflorus]|uniref:Uncharacterized protein n=1 Tax=Brachionus calyciflorus TaxID=104777 RepID=A0A813UA42_9BILA|nr:unnamed protein product [Brachionus calyciflorus]
MTYPKLILSLVCIFTVTLSLCYAKPIKAKNFNRLSQPLKNNFLDILGKRGQNKCERILVSISLYQKN